MGEGAAALHARRVLIVSQLPPPVHGSAIMTLHLIDALKGSGASVDIVDKRFSRTPDDVGVLRVGKLLGVPGLLWRLARGVRLGHPDTCVYFLTSRPASFLVDACALQLLRALRVPVVLYLHTSGYSALARRSPVWRRLVASTLRSARSVVTLGPRLVPDVADLLAGRQVEVIANTAGTPVRATRGPGEAGPFRVLFLSNLLPEKGVDSFVRMADRLSRDLPGAMLAFEVAGAGSPDRQLAVQEAVQRSGLSGSFTLHGPVDTPGKWRLLNRADVLVFPSTYRLEAQPLTIIEAMATSTAVVAWDTGGIGDLVVDGRSGVLVPAGDEAGLVTAVRDLAVDRERASNLGAGAVQLYDEAHSPEAFRRNWERVLSATSVVRR